MVEVAGDEGTREDSLGLVEDIALAVAARDVGEEQLPDAGIARQRRGPGGGQVAELVATSSAT